MIFNILDALAHSLLEQPRDGDLIAYFAGSSAGFTNEIGLLVNGVDTGIDGLNNQASAHGDSLNFGAVNKGDSLVFILKVLNPSDVGTGYSQKSLNSDNTNHVYSAAYAGDAIVPEPATLATLAMGPGLMGALRRKARK